MARHLAWILAALVTFPAATAAAAPSVELPAVGAQRDQQKDSKQNEPRRFRWWSEATHRAELGITDAQSAAIERIFQAHIPEQRERYRELERLEPELAKIIKEGTAAPDVVARTVERVEDLTAQIRKTRIVTLYRMQQELTPAQRAKFHAMDERRRQGDSRKSPAPAHRY